MKLKWKDEIIWYDKDDGIWRIHPAIAVSTLINVFVLGLLILILK